MTATTTAPPAPNRTRTRTAATPSATAPDAEQRRAEFIANAPAHLARARARLLTPEGEPARAYLAARGIHPQAAHLCGIGYTLNAYDISVSRNRPALVFGQENASGLTAIGYRFISGEGLKYALRKNSLRNGLFMPPSRNAAALIICEGEINAVSIWQATINTNAADVVSVGAQSVTDAQRAQLVELAKRYKRVITWLDESDKAAKEAAALNAKAVKTLTFEGVKYDANALLTDGLQWQSGRFVQQARKMPPLAEYIQHLINS